MNHTSTVKSKDTYPNQRRRKMSKNTLKLKEISRRKKLENKEYYDKKHRVKKSEIKEGDIVICKQKKKDKVIRRFDPDYHTVMQRKHNTVLTRREGKTITSNVSDFKNVIIEESDDEWESSNIKAQTTEVKLDRE